jgi:hypothetical protein
MMPPPTTLIRTHTSSLFSLIRLGSVWIVLMALVVLIVTKRAGVASAVNSVLPAFYGKFGQR